MYGAEQGLTYRVWTHARGAWSLVTGDLELILVYDVSRCNTPDATLRHIR